jgi:hypothetical protein
MCQHCDWLRKTAEAAVLAGETATAYLMNSPRHTPETEAAFLAGAVVVHAMQGLFQAFRTRNPEALRRLLQDVDEWARNEHDVWPIVVGDVDTGKPVAAGEPKGQYPDVAKPAGMKYGAEPLAADVAKVMAANGSRFTGTGRWVAKEWNKSQKADGTYPVGHPLAELTADALAGIERDRKEEQDVASRIAADLQNILGPGAAVHDLGAFSFGGDGPPTYTPPAAKPAHGGRPDPKNPPGPPAESRQDDVIPFPPPGDGTSGR